MHYNLSKHKPPSGGFLFKEETMNIPEELLNTLAYDFLEAYDGDKEKKIAPFEFWKRWREKGYDIPTDMDIHDILQYVRAVGIQAWKIKEAQDEKKN